MHGTSSGRGNRQEPREPTIQITSNARSRGSRIVPVGSAQDLESLRATFEHRHCVRLLRFVEGPLLDRVRSYVEEGEFSMREYAGMLTEPVMEEGKAAELLMLLVNDPQLFEHVRTITGCKRIGRFDGGVHRMMPGPEHAEPWHGEIFGHHVVEMSIDLSARPYSGGVVQLRDRYSHAAYTEVETEPGDAVLVRLAPFLQRRVTAVEGDQSRTVYSGRFMLRRKGAESELARPRAGGLTTDGGPARRRRPATPRR